MVKYIYISSSLVSPDPNLDPALDDFEGSEDTSPQNQY